MKINPKTLKIEIDLNEVLEPDFESRLNSLGRNISEVISNIFTGIKSVKEEFEASEEYQKVFIEFCKKKLHK